MDYASSPFHKFRGWKLLALIVITLGYASWYSVMGPYSVLADLAPGMPLEERGYYTGAQAVETLSALDASGRKAKYISLVFDIPNMILSALLFEGLIAFGIRRLSLNRAKWGLLFVLPIAFLLADFGEDSFLALTLSTGSQTLGTIAGILTAVKFFTYIAAALAGLLLSFSGLGYWLVKGWKAGK